MSGLLSLLLSLLLLVTVAACSSGGDGSAVGPVTVPVADGGDAGGDAPTSSVPRGGTLRLGVTGLDSLDPLDVVPSQASELMAVDLLFESLTTIDPRTQAVRPALAAKWTADEALTVWTFDLRPGIVFADDRPVTATDVKFTLERLVAKGGTSLAGARLEVIAGWDEVVAGTAEQLRGVEVVNAATVRITTTGPYAPLPELLASPLYGIVPRAVVEERRTAFGQAPVGSGPFMLAPGSAAPGGEADTAAGTPGTEAAPVQLVRSPKSAANLDGVELHRFADVDAAYRALRDGGVDWAAVPVASAEEARGIYGDALLRPSAFTRFFAFNLANPVLADVRYRQAVVQAVDRQALVDEVLGGGQVMAGVVPPSVPGGGVDPCGAPCAYDPEAARRLLAEAYPGAAPPALEVQYVVDPADPAGTAEKLAIAVAADLQAVGIAAVPAGKTFEDFRVLLATGQGQLFAYGWWGITPDQDVYLGPLLAGGSPDNVMGFASGPFDEGLARARGTADRTARQDVYTEIEWEAMAQAPVLPVAAYESFAVLNPAFRDFWTRPDGTFDALAVWRQV